MQGNNTHPFIRHPKLGRHGIQRYTVNVRSFHRGATYRLQAYGYGNINLRG